MTIRSVCTGLFLLSLAGAAAAQTTTYSCSALGGSNCTARILDGPQAAITSTLQLPAAAATQCSAGSTVTLAVQLNIIHSWIGDLTAAVANPSASSSTLLSNLAGAGVGGCQGSDVSALFQDGGTAAACSGLIPAVGGTVAPVSPLAPLASANGAPSGQWTLTVTDTANNNEGALLDWGVSVSCAALPNYEYVPVPTLSVWTLLLTGVGLGFVALIVLRRRRSIR
ncbi:MAG: hypothetical protein ABI451_02125 [Dokdonella sp.]